MPVHVTVISLSPPTDAVPIAGAEAGRDKHPAAGHCPGALPDGQATDATRVTLIGNAQYQPETQDPLGLTRARSPQMTFCRGAPDTWLMKSTSKVFRDSPICGPSRYVRS